MPQQIQLVRVKTTLGDRIYPLDALVYTNVGGKDLFFRERVGDLNGNEMIVWQNQFIDATLDDVLPHLVRSPRYRRAEEVIFAQNSRGVKIPQFRIQLIRALAAKGIIDAGQNGNLEQRIMLEEGKDFTSQQYAAMSRFVHQGLQQVALEDRTPVRSEDQIRNWLEGRTWAPQTPSLLYALAVVTGSDVLEEWWTGANDSGASSTGFWKEYKFYTTLHQQIMRYLGRSKGQLKEKIAEPQEKTETNNGNKQAAKGEGFDLTQEIELVLNQFMEEIDEEFSIASVVAVEKMEIGAKDYHTRKEQLRPKLKDGAYTGSPRESMKQLSLTEIIGEKSLFQSLAIDVLMEYLEGCTAGRYESSAWLAAAYNELKAHEVFKNSHIRRQLVGAIEAKTARKLGLLGQRKETSDDISAIDGVLVAGTTLRFYRPGTNENILAGVLETISDTLAESIRTGELDLALGIPPHSVYNVMNHSTKLFFALPRCYIDMVMTEEQAQDITLDRQARRDAQHKLEKLIQKLERAYSLFSTEPKGPFLSHIIGSMWAAAIAELQRVPASSGLRQKKVIELIRETAPRIDYILNPETAVTDQAARQFYERNNHRYFTRAETLAILERHGLREVHRFIPESNFVFEAAFKP